MTEWEIKGAPLRVELGPRDLADGAGHAGPPGHGGEDGDAARRARRRRPWAARRPCRPRCSAAATRRRDDRTHDVGHARGGGRGRAHRLRPAPVGGGRRRGRGPAGAGRGHRPVPATPRRLVPETRTSPTWSPWWPGRTERASASLQFHDVTLLPFRDDESPCSARCCDSGVPRRSPAPAADRRTLRRAWRATPNRAWVDTMPAAYDRWLVPTVFHPFAVDLARRAAAQPVGEALELAAGTGVLTRELVAVAGAVTATDLNDAMVDLGARRVPAARWQQADAMRLPFDDAAFDLVACQFGVMFFPDKPAAFAEAARVLAPGGRVLMNTWAAARHPRLRGRAGHRAGAGVPRRPADVHGRRAARLRRSRRVRRRRGGGRPALRGRSPRSRSTAPPPPPPTSPRATAGAPRCAPRSSARGDLGTATAAVAEEMTALLGEGPVTGAMTAHVPRGHAPPLTTAGGGVGSPLPRAGRRGRRHPRMASGTHGGDRAMA